MTRPARKLEAMIAALTAAYLWVPVPVVPLPPTSFPLLYLRVWDCTYGKANFDNLTDTQVKTTIKKSYCIHFTTVSASLCVPLRQSNCDGHVLMCNLLPDVVVYVQQAYKYMCSSSSSSSSEQLSMLAQSSHHVVLMVTPAVIIERDVDVTHCVRVLAAAAF